MSIHLADSTVYGHLWATTEARALFDEVARFQAWLDILATLAEAQHDVGMVPAAAAAAIRARAVDGSLDLDEVAAETRATGHSTLGLIRVLRKTLPEDAREWVYYGATVQDLTDTWTSMVLRKVGDLLDRDLVLIEASCLRHARHERDTPMLGRTHAQPGLPITFGFKAATWAAEISRHRARLNQGRERWELVQLGGALGTMEFFGDDGLPLLEAFGRRLGLGVPVIPWITSRDGVTEFVHLLAMVTSTIAKIGNEVMELQRQEIGEVREGFSPGTVGSITMPQKRNPELSEHLDTLARLVRSNASVLAEGMVQIHERDGRGWKAEWIAVPEACTLGLAATGFGLRLVDGLELMPDRMLLNIEAQRGYVFAEPVMRGLADRIGKHTAHDVVYEASMAGIDRGLSFREALLEDPRVTAHFDESAISAMFDIGPVIGPAGAFVDRVTGGQA